MFLKHPVHEALGLQFDVYTFRFWYSDELPFVEVSRENDLPLACRNLDIISSCDKKIVTVFPPFPSHFLGERTDPASQTWRIKREIYSRSFDKLCGHYTAPRRDARRRRPRQVCINRSVENIIFHSSRRTLHLLLFFAPVLFRMVYIRPPR